MDIEFEQVMRKLMYAHMDDARNYFLEHGSHPLRAFVYVGLEYKNFTIPFDQWERSMKELQEMAAQIQATAVVLVGEMTLERWVKEHEKQSHNEMLKQPSEDSYRTLSVIVKLMDGQTMSIASEILGEKILDEAIFLENSQMFDVPIKPWGN